MLEEALDFLAESDALAALLEDTGETDFTRTTQFKNWSIEDVIGHLHLWNHTALLTLEDSAEFQKLLKWVVERMTAGRSHLDLQGEWLAGRSGRVLYEDWKSLYSKLADAYRDADPDRRVPWAGPDMSVRSCIAARQMETWAHGQEVFDVLGVDRSDTDRIKNIAHIGVKTYGWSFRNRKEEVPTPKPYVRLTAPSGGLWEWNETQADNRVIGSATEFCQVVAQTRNVADTSLQIVGPAAARWMQIAQCFAGPPEDPPAKGTRCRAPTS